MAAWNIRGEYMETCNCTFLCPSMPTNMEARPTEGDCQAAISMRIDRGEKDGVKLDGLSFIVMLHAPGAVAQGNITVGLIVDERTSDKRLEAISAIATGAAGGPMAGLAPLVGKIAGVERRPIRFGSDRLKRTVTAGDLVDQACEGVPSASAPGEAAGIDNTAHPVSSRVALAKATRSIFAVFGMDRKDTSGTLNGHVSPFAWSESPLRGGSSRPPLQSLFASQIDGRDRPPRQHFRVVSTLPCDAVNGDVEDHSLRHSPNSRMSFPGVSPLWIGPRSSTTRAPFTQTP